MGGEPDAELVERLNALLISKTTSVAIADGVERPVGSIDVVLDHELGAQGLGELLRRGLDRDLKGLGRAVEEVDLDGCGGIRL